MGPRRLRILAYVLPLTLAACVLVWVRSYLPESFHPTVYRGRVVLIFAAAQHAKYFDPDGAERASTSTVLDDARQWGRLPGSHHWDGLGFELITSNPEFGYFVLAIPLWALVLPLAVLSAWSVMTYRRHNTRARGGHCLACGYDLRGGDGRCPECGATPDSPAVLKS